MFSGTDPTETMLGKSFELWLLAGLALCYPHRRCSLAPKQPCRGGRLDERHQHSGRLQPLRELFEEARRLPVSLHLRAIALQAHTNLPAVRYVSCINSGHNNLI